MEKMAVHPHASIDGLTAARKLDDHTLLTTETVGGRHVPKDSKNLDSNVFLAKPMTEEPHVIVADVDHSTHNGITDG